MSVDDNGNEQLVAESSRFANLDEEELINYNEIATANSEQSTKKKKKLNGLLTSLKVWYITYCFCLSKKKIHPHFNVLKIVINCLPKIF